MRSWTSVPIPRMSMLLSSSFVIHICYSGSNDFWVNDGGIAAYNSSRAAHVCTSLCKLLKLDEKERQLDTSWRMEA